MSKRLSIFLGAAMLLFTMAVAGSSQVGTATVTTQNPDGTYTIVEYPVGKETIVNLNPIGLRGATGTATIIRAAEKTTIRVNVTNLPKEVTSLNVYAVDPTGAVVSLGPVEIANGIGTFMTSAPLSKFMLIASPENALMAYNANTKIYFRSAIPEGLAVIPMNSAVGEQVATPTATVALPSTETVVAPAEYSVPMLGIPTFKRGDDTKLKINFTGAMEGARANVFIDPHSHGRATEVRMHFHDLKEAPKGTAYILWAVSPDNQFQRLGEIVNVKGRNEAEIRSETTFDDFGLMLTSEDLGTTHGTIIRPSGHRVGVIEIIR